MKKSTLNKFLGIILFILMWYVLSLLIGEDTFIFPGPIVSIKEAIKMLGTSYIYKCIGQTMLRMVGGFFVGFIIAFILGVFAGNNETFEQILSPIITIFKSLPTATLVYLFLVVIGARLTPMFIVVLVSFPILYEAILGGIKSTPQQLKETCKLFSSNIIYENVKVRIPLAIPYIIVGVASSFALSLKIEIMAEVITGYTRLGLGSAILAAQRSDPTNMVPVFSYSLVAIIIILVIDILSNKIKDKFSSNHM